MEVAAPGVVIAPGSSPLPDHEGTLHITHEEPAAEASAPASKVQESASPVEPEPSAEPQTDLEPQGGFFKSEANEEVAPAAVAGDAQSASWTAAEFVAHDKSAAWYLGLVVAAALLAFAVYVLTRDKVSVAVVVVAALVFGIYASHHPRQLDYKMDPRGLDVAGKHYSFEAFKSYSLGREGQLGSIVFMPLRRFGTSLTVYYDPKDEDKILPVLSRSLPYEEPRRDAVDSLMKKIRF